MIMILMIVLLQGIEALIKYKDHTLTEIILPTNKKDGMNLKI